MCENQAKIIFLAIGCNLLQSLRNETPLKIQFYYQTSIPSTKNIIYGAWQLHGFDFDLIFLVFLVIL